MLEYKGCSAWVTIDDEVTTEYATRILEETDKVECWIASEVGKCFRIHFGSTQPVNSTVSNRLSARVFLDGVLARSRFVSKSSSVSSIYISPTEVRDMVFSPLNLTDDDEHGYDSTNASYGEIRVEIWEVTDSGQTSLPSVPLMASQTVHEASKKAGVHCVGLSGPSKKVQALSHLVDYDNLLTTFTFYYKPLDVLQAHEIAPRPPPKSPSPAASPSRCPPPLEVDEESNEEFQRLQTQMQEIQARMDAISKGKRPAIKMEDGPPAKRVKREPIVVSGLLPGEVIDLTLDD